MNRLRRENKYITIVVVDQQSKLLKYTFISSEMKIPYIPGMICR